MLTVKQRTGRKMRSIVALTFLFVVSSSTVGCRFGEEITQSTEPRVERKKREAPKSEQATRILGAIAPVDERSSWFFKMMGPEDEVAKEAAAFDAFLSSVEFSKDSDKPITWKLPEGWREGPKKDGRLATILMGPAGKPLELSVISAGGDLLGNVNRWRGQVGLGPTKANELESCTKEVTTEKGAKLTRVDLTGTAGKAEKPKTEKIPTRILGVIAPGEEGQSWFFKLMGPTDEVGKEAEKFDAFVSSIEFTKDRDKPVKWVLPDGWSEGPKRPVRYATILMGPAADPLEMSVTNFGGGLLLNVNRWRDQVGLGHIEQGELESCAKEVTTKQGTKVTRVDLTGTSVGGKGPAMMGPMMKK